MSAVPEEEATARGLTAEEIQELPDWAMVALAARCAMRVQPLVGTESFRESRHAEIARHIEAVDMAVTIAAVPFTLRASTTTATAAARAATDAAGAATPTAAVHAARAAAHAATTVVLAADPRAAARSAIHAARTTARAARAAAGTANAFASAARTDYADLLSSGRDKGNAEFMNWPLWHGGEPDEWREYVNGWGEKVRDLGKEFPSLRRIYKLYIRLFDGKGIDVAEAEERIKAWLERQQKLEGELQGDAKSESGAAAILSATGALNTGAKKEEEPDAAANEADKPAIVDRRGAATSTIDKPTTEDHLDRKPLVHSLAAMFAAREQATPFTLALLGDWGAGKSSVMDQLRKELASGKYGGAAFEFLFATFNAWQYEHTDDIRAGLAQEVVGGLTQGLGFREHWDLRFRFALAAHRSELLRTLCGLGFTLLVVFALALVASMSSSQVLQSILGVSAAGGVAAFIVVAWKNVRTIINHPLATQLQTYLKLPDYGKHLGAVPVMKKHIETLCELRHVNEENATRRLVVFVDDLDRCGQECITQTFDAIRLVMEIPNVIVVIAIDYRIAFAAVAKHYANLAGANRSRDAIARDYLGKIIQLPVELPRPSSMQSFIRDRLFSTVNSDEVDVLSRQRDLQSLDEMLETISGDDEKSSDKGGIEETAEASLVPGAEPGFQTVEESKDHEPVPTTMRETAKDCRLFERWTRAFKFNNPRQLIRLRNTYRLLTQLDHALDHESSDELRIAMLFWLEFLYQKPIKEQTQYADVLVPRLVDTLPDAKCPPQNDRMHNEITHFGIRGALHAAFGDEPDKQRSEYERIKQHVGRFVLRFGGELPRNGGQTEASSTC